MRSLWLGWGVAVFVCIGCAPGSRKCPEYAVSWGSKLEGVPCFTFYTAKDAPLFGDRTAMIEVDPKVGFAFHLFLKNHSGQDALVIEFGGAWGQDDMRWRQWSLSRQEGDVSDASNHVWGTGLGWDPPQLLLFRQLPAAQRGNDKWYFRHEIKGHIPLRAIPGWDYIDLTLEFPLVYHVPGYVDMARVSVCRRVRLT